MVRDNDVKVCSTRSIWQSKRPPRLVWQIWNDLAKAIQKMKFKRSWIPVEQLQIQSVVFCIMRSQSWLFYENRFRRFSVILQTTFHTVSVILQTDTHEICWGDAQYREAGRYLKWPCSVIFSAFDRTLTFSMVSLNQGRGTVVHIKKCGEITLRPETW